MVTRGILVSADTDGFGLGGTGVTDGFGLGGTGRVAGAAGAGQGLAVGAHGVQGLAVVVHGGQEVVAGAHGVQGLAVVVHGGQGFAVVVHGLGLAQLSHLAGAQERRYWRSRLHEEQELHSRLRWAQANTSAEPSRRVPNLRRSGTRRMFDPH
jgi:hypothetical protein